VPFTYLSHQAPVLAAKMRWPGASDGTALVFGSMAPDWAYAVDHTWLEFDGHSIWGVVAFCVPMAVLAAVVVRGVAPTLFAYVPSPGWVPLRRLRGLGRRRPGWAMSAGSALIGALSHVVWDMVTHHDRWGPQHVRLLRAEAMVVAGRGLSWATVLQYISHVLGAVVTIYLLSRMLRSGALGTAGDDAGVPPGTVRFWVIATIGLAAGIAVAPLGDPGFPGQLIRISLGVGVGLVAAAAACTGDVRRAAAA
jgi:hypothetical protein